MPDYAWGMPAEGAGPKLNTRQRNVTIGGATATVLEQRVIPISERVRSGVYVAEPGPQTVLGTADAAPAGRWFLINPVGSGLFVALRRVDFMSQIGSALITPTSPRVQLCRFAFTGTATGAAVSPANSRTANPANVGSLRTASTGLTITVGNPFYSFLPVASLSATAASVAALPSSEDTYAPSEEEMQVLAPGEGVYLRQPDAGTTSDTRRYVTNVAWEEFTLP